MSSKPDTYFTQESIVSDIRDQQKATQTPHDHFLAREDFERLLIQNESLFHSWGYSNVSMGDEPAVNYDGVIFSVPLNCHNVREDVDERHFVTLSLVDGRCSYRFTKNQHELFSFPAPPAFEEEWLMEHSRGAKIVKSRPKFLYPELFDLPYEEVWPKNMDIAVIGDPYQSCDGDRITLVEYEYAEEIFPPLLRRVINEKTSLHFDDSKSWLENFFYEDLNALKNIYHAGTPLRGNPYDAVADDLLNLCSWMGEKCTPDKDGFINEEELAYTEEQLKKIRILISKLKDGSWTMEDILPYAPLNKDEIIAADDAPESDRITWEQGLREFFEIKQDQIIGGMNNPIRWRDFINVWECYLERIPVEKVRDWCPDIVKRMDQARYWLKELPTSTSPQRITKGIDWMQNLYRDIVTGAPKNERVHDLYSSELSDTNSRGKGGMMSDNVFGYFVPGYPVDFRTRKFLDALVRRTENMLNYVQDIWPKIQKIIQELEEKGIEMDPETKIHYLRSFERPLIQSACFTRLTQKAIPVHGFFPYKTTIAPQDRILALTSVTMHGWNYYGELGFQRDFEAALLYLKPNGQYILGPINQRVYFGGEEEFDAEGLTRALTRMREEGKITFYFKKGRRQYDDNESDVPFSPEIDVLLPGESAYSLVITKVV